MFSIVRLLNLACVVSDRLTDLGNQCKKKKNYHTKEKGWGGGGAGEAKPKNWGGGGLKPA